MKISDTEIYPYTGDINSDDYWIGTNSITLETRNFQLGEVFAFIQANLNLTIPTKTSDLENDGDGTSPFVTANDIPTSELNLQEVLDNGNSAIFTDEGETENAVTEVNIGGDSEFRYFSLATTNGKQGEEEQTSLIYIKTNQSYLQSIVGFNNGICGLTENGLPKLEATYNDPESEGGFVRLTTEDPIEEKEVEVKIQSDKPSNTYYLQPESNKSSVYKALLNQEGVADPSAIVLSTDFPAPIVWTREDIGVYRGTLTGAFGESKTFVPQISLTGQGNSTLVYKQDDYIEISTFDSNGDSSDDLLSFSEILIQVYNI